MVITQFCRLIQESFSSFFISKEVLTSFHHSRSMVNGGGLNIKSLSLLLFTTLFAFGCSNKFFKNTKSGVERNKPIAHKSDKTVKHKKKFKFTASTQSNICKIFSQQPSWYQSALKSQKKWRIPIHVMMSIMKQESSFKAKARPPRRIRVGVFGKKTLVSSAYGYAQAQNGTWRDYQKSTGKHHHRRDIFDHAINFIGWYAAQARRDLKLKNYDTYNLYLSYHDGMTGFRLKTYKKKPWLMRVAKKVRHYGYRYAKQLKRCAYQLKKNAKVDGRDAISESQTLADRSRNLRHKSTRKIKKTIPRSSQKKKASCKKVFGVWPLCKPFEY